MLTQCAALWWYPRCSQHNVLHTFNQHPPVWHVRKMMEVGSNAFLHSLNVPLSFRDMFPIADKINMAIMIIPKRLAK